MANLRERIIDRLDVLVRRSNSCIPQILSDNPFEYARSLLRNSLDHSNFVEKISVIDPYILPIDLDNLTSIFGGSSNITLEVISKFNSSSSQEEKQERKLKINDRKAYLIKNGLLKGVELIQSTESMHDRYYLYWSDGVMVRVFCIGGSVNQMFKDYISIIEITDKFMLSNISIYYDKLVSNRIDFIKV